MTHSTYGWTITAITQTLANMEYARLIIIMHMRVTFEENNNRMIEVQPISIKVFFLDRSFYILSVTSQTLASQVKTALAGALRLNHTASICLLEMKNPQPGWEFKACQNRQVMNR